MIKDDDPFENQETNGISYLVEVKTETEEPYFQITPQVVTGKFPPKNLKFKGLLDSIVVIVLIDIGRTHNIQQQSIVQHLKIPTKSIPDFSLMVGNRSHL